MSQVTIALAEDASNIPGCLEMFDVGSNPRDSFDRSMVTDV